MCFRFKPHCLHSGRHAHRTLSSVFRLGPYPAHKGAVNAASAARSQGLLPSFALITEGRGHETPVAQLACRAWNHRVFDRGLRRLLFGSLTRWPGGRGWGFFFGHSAWRTQPIIRVVERTVPFPKARWLFGSTRSIFLLSKGRPHGTTTVFLRSIGGGGGGGKSVDQTRTAPGVLHSSRLCRLPPSPPSPTATLAI